MKASEFYEVYWRISDGKGGYIKPPALSDAEKEYLDKAAETDCDHVQFFRTRRRPTQINLNYLKEDMNKLPKYFFPVNQPKLDKWGNILNSENDNQ